MKKKLSILICSVPTRVDQAARLRKELYRQIDELDACSAVQVLMLEDSFELTVGEKRNKLLEMSCGEYVNYLDDDDEISERYVDALLMGIAHGTDVVTFRGEFHNAGHTKHNFVISKDLATSRFTGDVLYRLPNHLCPVKREIAEAIRFPIKTYGEDKVYSEGICKLIKSEYHIPEKLYFYLFDSTKSETHKRSHE